MFENYVCHNFIAWSDISQLCCIDNIGRLADKCLEGKTKKGKVTFQIKGKKIYPKDLRLKDKPFSISFTVNTTRENIIIETSDVIDKIKPKYEKGIYRKEFPMKKIQNL